MKTGLLSLVEDILAKRPVAPWRRGRCPQRPLVAGWVGVLLLWLSAGSTGAQAQAISNPNQISGTIRWNNSAGPVLDFLKVYGFVGGTVYANQAVPAGTFSAQQNLSDLGVNYRISMPYEITVQGDLAPGIHYDVSPFMNLPTGLYRFAQATSDGVIYDTVNRQPGPLVALDFTECAGLVTVKFCDPSGNPVPINTGSVTANIQPSGEQQAYGGPQANVGATEHTLVVRGGNTFIISVGATITLGNDPFSDYFQLTFYTNYTQFVDCNQWVTNKFIIPPIVIGPGTPLGSITGRVDMLRESEHWSERQYTKMEAYNGPDDNYRYADVGLLTQPDYLPCPAPSPTAGTPSCNSAGPYSLVNLLPSDFLGPNKPYGVRAFQIFRQGHGFETFVSPPLSGVTVPRGGQVNLGDTFVINPGYVTGDILLCGPDTTNSILRRLIRNTDNLNSQGMPHYLGFEYSSFVRAAGLNDLGPGATFTAYLGEARASFDGAFQTSGPDQNHWVGSYNLVLGGLGGPSGQTTYWDQRYLRLYFSSTPPVPTTDRDNYISSSVQIRNHQFGRQEIIPGQTIRADHRYGGSCVIVDFRANSGTLFDPRVSGSGTFSGTFQTIPASYDVLLDFAVGTPVDIGTATSAGQVVMYLPQGDYTLNPTVNSVNPGGGFTFNTLQPFSLNVPPCSKVRVTPCVQMTLSNSVPECATTNRLHVTGSVDSCTNITSITYVLNGGAPVTVCNNCGISPSFAFDITLSDCANKLNVIAIAANGDVSSVESTVHYDVTPPVLSGCTSISTNSLDGTNGNFVSYSITALDDCDGVVPVTCVPPSGSFFAEGSTVVTCTAVDHCGNTNTCQFTVEVRSEGCLRISNTNVVCLSNAPGSYRYSFTAQNRSPSAVKYLFVVPEPDCFTTSPSFFTFSPALQPGQSANVSLALNNLSSSCGDRLCFILSLHTSNFIFCCAVTNCISNPSLSVNCAADKSVPCGTAWIFDPPSATSLCCGTNLTVTSLATTTNGICPRIFQRIWQITDCLTNTATCTQTVTEVDTILYQHTGNTPPTSAAEGWTSSISPNTTVGPVIDSACSNTPAWSVVNSTAEGFGFYSVVPTAAEVMAASNCWRLKVTLRVTQASDSPGGSMLCLYRDGGSSYQMHFGSEANGDAIVVLADNSGFDSSTGPRYTVPGGLKCNTFELVRSPGTPGADLYINGVLTHTAWPGFAFLSPPLVAWGDGSTRDLAPENPRNFSDANYSKVEFSICCCPTNPCSAPLLVNCPTNLTVSAAGSNAVVNYTTPTVTGGVFAGCTPPSGSMFSLGTTIVTCTATNACGSSNTCVFTVSVLNSTNCPCPVAATAPVPANDSCASAIPISTGVTYGYTFNATPSPVGSIVQCGGSLTTPDVWYVFTAPCPGGTVCVDTCLDPCFDSSPSGNSAHFDTVLSVYTGTCPLLTQVACNNNSSACGTNYALSSRKCFVAKPLVPYLIRVSGHLGATGCFALNVAFTPDPPTPLKNDSCANAITVLCNQPKAFNTCNAATDGPNDCPITKDVWYKYVPACTGAVSVATCGSFFDTALAVYTGSCSALNLVACNNDATAGPCAGSLQSRVTFDAMTPGTTYYIRVGGANGASGFGNLSVVGPNPASGTCPPTNYCSTVPKKRLYRVSGTSLNTPWSWCLSSPCCFNISGTVNNPPPLGAPASALVKAMVDSISNVCPGQVTAHQLPYNANWNPTTNLFWIAAFDCDTCCVPSHEQRIPFVVRVGAAGAPCDDMCVVIPKSRAIAIPTTGPCAFNPFIDEEPLSELDCNQNGEDDTIDILTGTSLDNDENGVPDGCAIGLSIAYDPSGDETVISWAATDAILEQSSSVTGPWHEVPGATSPHVVGPPTGQTFFRLRRP